MRKVGADSEITKANILKAAKKEFLKKGYQGASLREICEEAKVTTGAIYCFFNGKEDLFEKIVISVIDPMVKYFSANVDDVCKMDNPSFETTKAGDAKMANYIVNTFYEDRDIWHIIVNNVNQPVIEKYMKQFLDTSTAYYVRFFNVLKNTTDKEVDIFALKTFSHMQLNTMLAIASHDFTKTEFKRNIYYAMNMLRAGLYSLLGEDLSM